MLTIGAQASLSLGSARSEKEELDVKSMAKRPEPKQDEKGEFVKCWAQSKF